MDYTKLNNDQRTACSMLLGDLLGRVILVESDLRRDMPASVSMSIHLMFKGVEREIYDTARNVTGR